MRASIVVLCLALYVAAVYADCDPNGDGKPDCTGIAKDTRFRNFWDPTRYWQCNGSAEPDVVKCEQQGFLTEANDCVPWSQWTWVDPCPESK